MRTRAGNANIVDPALSESEQPPQGEIEQQLIYTLHPLRWREGSSEMFLQMGPDCPNHVEMTAQRRRAQNRRRSQRPQTKELDMSRTRSGGVISVA